MQVKPTNQIYKIYLELLEKYGSPKDFWQKWCKRKKTLRDKEEIVLGAMLTQRVSWFNVEKALENLRGQKALSVKGAYELGKRDIKLLEGLIKPSGFYKQKAQRIFGLCEFLERSGGFEKFLENPVMVCRDKLLALNGIGPETADSILLYAGGKPVFVIDEYTRRFVERRKLSKIFSYSHLQDLFQRGLPQEVMIYQDYHAMIVLEGRGTSWDLLSKI